MRIGMGLGLGMGGRVRDGLADLLTANLTEFWRADMGTDSASAVGTWTGQKTGATMVQATAAKKPPVTAGTIGSRAGLVGNGAASGGATDGRRLDNTTIVFGTSFTVIVAATWVNDGTVLVNTRLVDWQAGANRLIGKYGTDTWKVYNGAFFGSTAASSGTPVILTYKQTNGVGGRLYINGTSVGSNATSVVGTTGFSVLGANAAGLEYHEGALGAVAVHATSALSDADRQVVEGIMGRYYKVAGY